MRAFISALRPEGFPKAEAAVAAALNAAVQGICRVRVDEVGFGEVVQEEPPMVDKRKWD